MPLVVSFGKRMAICLRIACAITTESRTEPRMYAYNANVVIATTVFSCGKMNPSRITGTATGTKRPRTLRRESTKSRAYLRAGPRSRSGNALSSPRRIASRRSRACSGVSLPPLPVPRADRPLAPIADTLRAASASRRLGVALPFVASGRQRPCLAGRRGWQRRRLPSFLVRTRAQASARRQARCSHSAQR